MRRAILLISLVIAAGCSDDTATSPTSALDGTWRLISIQPASQPVQPPPTGAQYQVGFEDARILVRVDCNTCTGSFTVNGDTLVIGPVLACTRAACATASYEHEVVTLLSGSHQMSRTLHNLTLTSSRGTMLLQR